MKKTDKDKENRIEGSSDNQDQGDENENENETPRVTRSGKIFDGSQEMEANCFSVKVGKVTITTNGPVKSQVNQEKSTKGNWKIGEVRKKIVERVEELMEKKQKVDLSDPLVRKMFIYEQQLDIAERQSNYTMPEKTDTEWLIEKVIKHKKINGEIKLLVKWKLGGREWISFEDALTHEPYMVLKYANKLNLYEEKGWE